LAPKTSKIRFRTREINEWLGKSLRFKDTPGEKNNGLDVVNQIYRQVALLFCDYIGN